jgi:hypothetical protein
MSSQQLIFGNDPIGLGLSMNVSNLIAGLVTVIVTVLFFTSKFDEKEALTVDDDREVA